jgi:PKD repeat protein
VSRERLAPWAMFAASAVTAALACRNGAVPPPDAGPDGATTDGPTLLSLEVAVTGCASFTGGALCGSDSAMAPRCVGSPPLALSFSPVGSAQLTQFTWSFGDGTATVTERAPSHTFVLPGCYEVTLVGEGNTGTVTPRQPQVIEVRAQPIGAPCDIDGQCAGGFECSCAPEKACAPAFTHGLCSVACDTAQCGDRAVCAALAFASGADAGTPVRRPRCVASCASDADCAPGFACPALRASGTSGATGWVRGCLPIGAQRDVGAPCRNENEVLDPDSCGTGVCADVGALGVCSFGCDDRSPCPSGAACVRRRSMFDLDLCLASCTSDADCARDPLFACVAGLTDDGGAGISVCAPRSCATDDECSPSGRCGANSVCVRR